MNHRARTSFFLLSAALFTVLGCSEGTSSSGTTASTTSSSSNAGEHFSFFATSLKAMQDLSGNPQGFGGDLRYGETGPGAGLRGADKICAAIAEKSMPGAGAKQWRAFLSAVAGEDGKQVNAIDRIGEGPWYDRVGRLLANNKAELLNDRPTNADPAIINDFPNEEGIPNHAPDPNQPEVDNHDFLTGTDTEGKLFNSTATCKDWTGGTGDPSEGRPRVGHSWPRGGDMMFPGDGGVMIFDGGPFPPPDGGMSCMTFPPPPDGGMDCPFPPPDGGPFPFPDGGMGTFGSGNNWMSALDESGCAPGVNIVEMGPPNPNSNTVGSGGGYGGIYCFALTP